MIRTISFALVVLSVIAASACTNRGDAGSSSSTGMQYADYLAKSTARQDEIHAKVMADLDETHSRDMALMDRDERDQQRFEQVLAGWEKQQAEYQKYLDSLPKHP